MSASLYDAIEVKGKLRPRLNKVFVSPDKVPENVMAQLTKDNVIDENGTIIVDEKQTDESQQPTTENTEELNEEKKLTRVDQSSPEKTPLVAEDPAPDPQTSQVPPVVVDDSANENQTLEEGDQDATISSDQSSKNSAAPVAKAAPAPAAPEPTPAPAPAPSADVSTQPKRATRANSVQEPVEKFRSKVPQSSPGMGFPRKNGKTVDIFDLTTPHTHTKLVSGVAVPLSAENFKSKGELAIQNRLAELGIETIDFERDERDAAMAGVAEPGLMLEDDERDEDIQLG